MRLPPRDFYGLGALAALAFGEPIAVGRLRSMQTRNRGVKPPRELKFYSWRFMPFQLPHDLADDLAWQRTDIDGDRPLIRRRFLERGELVVEQGRRHEMALPSRHALADQVARAF